MNNIDKIYCINLPHRTDRWEQCLKNFEKLNCTNYQRIDGQRVQHGFLGKQQNANLGLITSMINCFKDCVQNNYNNIIIFEDDFLPTNNFNFDLMSKTIDSVLSTNDWDLLYLGYRKKGDIKEYNRVLNRIYGAYTTHAILYSRKYVEKLLIELPSEQWDNDRIKRWMDDYRAIDVYFTNQSKHRKYYCGHVNLFTQMASYSDIVDCEVDYSRLI